MDFGGVEPDVNVGVSQSAFHTDSLLRIDLQHLLHEVLGLLGCVHKVTTTMK